MSLLDIVQDIMSDMDADEVNSIMDTQESLQVAQIVKSTYYNIIDGRDYPFLYELFQVNASADNTKPTHLSLPESLIDLKWLKYNNNKVTDTADKYETIKYMHPEDFMNLCDSRLSDSDNVQVVTDSNGITLNILNDTAPQYFTSFDDEVLVLDAFDSAKGDTLLQSQTQAWGKLSVAWTMDDSFTPDLPVQMFMYLLNEAKSTCFLTLKQQANQKAEQLSVSQKRRMSQDAWKLQKGVSYPDYGRKSGGRK